MPLFDGRRVRSADPAGKPTLVDAVHAQLRDRIILGEILGGDLLVESQLASEFGVSKTPVREALSLLSQEGFVEVIPRQGYRVTTISIKDIHEIYELRVVLEGEAAALAAQRGTPKEIAAFRERIGKMGSALGSESKSVSAADVMRLDDAFHMGIAQLAHNRRLSASVQRLLREAIRIRLADPHLSPEGILAEGEGTERIYDALEQGDSHAARALMVDHVLLSKERVLRGLLDPVSGPGIHIEGC